MDTFPLVLDGLAALCHWDSFLIMVFGIIVGIIGGALPGFSSTNTTALMLPLTFVLPPHQALILIAGIYCGAMWGDAIPAILFSIPGTPAAGAQTFDGYPLALQGKADIALGLSLGSSLAGGVVGGILTIILIPVMAGYALKFGPAELFLLALAAIIIVSSISEGKEARRKGLVSGLFGLLLATITACPAFAQPRLWFGFYELFEEIPLVSAMIGIFAIPTIIQFAFKDRIIDAEVEVTDVGNVKKQIEGIIEVFKRWGLTLRSTLIGWIIGAIPGTGATVATYVAYGQAKMWAKDAETYGKGNYDGVIAGDAANNAVTGGALVPTLTLGIPGSGTTAIMLVVFIIHGIIPGPRLISENAAAVYALLAATLVAPFIMTPMGLIINRYSAKLTALKSAYLLPTLFALCLIGSYAVRLYFFDIYLALLFGLLGLLMYKLKYPVIPFVMGIILGPIAEQNLFRVTRLMKGWSIFTSGICITILAIIVVLVFCAYIYPAFKKPKSSSI